MRDKKPKINKAMIYKATFILSLLLFSDSLFSEVCVHVWGEVKKPGEYYVPAGINVLELISKAGGPTEYANIKNITLTHREVTSDRVVKVNLNDYLKNKELKKPIPVVENGDIVRVPRNRWYRWRTLIKIAADVAIIANAYYWFSRD